MLYSFFLISYIIIAHHFLSAFSNAIPSVEDKMLIAFVRNDQKMQISEYSKQKYEAHLGILYFMRMNWQCDKMADEFEEYERTECPKYRKYLDILYEYLFMEYVGIPTVKPKFVFKKQFKIEGPIIYTVNCLVNISQFYFGSRNNNIYKLKKKFNNIFKPILLNEEKINYEFKLGNESKLPINEMILQLAIDSANEWQTNENLDGIIKQSCGEKFVEYLEEMFKKAEERAKKDNPREANQINDDKHNIILYSKFDDKWNWTEDALILEFVKGLATNFVKFFEMAKEYSNYLSQIKEKGYIYGYNRQMINFGLYKIEKMKKHLQQKYEAHLGIIYLMRKNWHCDKIACVFKKYKRKCQKYRKYFDILYEYLFRLYAEAKNPKLSQQLPPLVKPIFIVVYFPESLIDVVKKQNDNNSIFFAGYGYR